jgi:release factor glutamine methyltransferase
VAGLDLLVLPTVFHPKIFLTSAFFAEFLQSLELSGKRVAEIGTGSGILALSGVSATTVRESHLRSKKKFSIRSSPRNRPARGLAWVFR